MATGRTPETRFCRLTTLADAFWLTTPAGSGATLPKFLPSAVIVLDREADDVLTMGASAVTSTVSIVAPTFRVSPNIEGWPASYLAFSAVVRKPGLSTLIL